MGSEHVTQAEFARRKGTTPQAVSAALTSGRLRRGPGGRLNWDEASAAWDATSRGDGAAAGTRRRIDVGVLPDLDAARLEVEREKARKLKIENDRAEGSSLDAEETARAWFGAARSLRDRLLALPARLAAEIPDQSDEHGRRVAIERELRRAIGDFCEEMPR